MPTDQQRDEELNTQLADLERLEAEVAERRKTIRHIREQHAAEQERWESSADYADQHGGRGVRDGGNVLYPDGSIDGGTIRMSAPKDKLTLLRRQIAYYRASLERTNSDAQRLHDALTGRSFGFKWTAEMTALYGPAPMPPTPANGHKALAIIRNRQEEESATLAKLEEELDELVKGPMWQARRLA